MTQSDTGFTERTSEVASSTKEHASDVASTAGEQARGVAQEAKQQGRDLLYEARGTVRRQASGQKDRAAGQLRSVADELRSMREGTGGQNGAAAELVRQASEQTDRLAAWLEGREPTDILDEIRSFARQRPGTFLLGCLAAGFVVGRLVKGAASAGPSSARTSQYGTYPRSRLTGDYTGGYSGAPSFGSDLGTGTGSAYATTGAYGAGGVAASETTPYDSGAYESTSTYRSDSDTSDTTVAGTPVSGTGAAYSDTVDDNPSTAVYPDESVGDPWQDDDARRPTQSGGSGV